MPFESLVPRNPSAPLWQVSFMPRTYISTHQQLQGELQHRNPKSGYIQTDRKLYVLQLTKIERHQTCLRQMRDKLYPAGSLRLKEDTDTATSPTAHHHIGQSQNSSEHIGSFLRDHAGDPAVQVCTYSVPGISSKTKRSFITPN